MVTANGEEQLLAAECFWLVERETECDLFEGRQGKGNRFKSLFFHHLDGLDSPLCFSLPVPISLRPAF